MVLILNDGSKVEMKSLPLFREKQKFIEENINKRSQIPQTILGLQLPSAKKFQKKL